MNGMPSGSRGSASSRDVPSPFPLFESRPDDYYEVPGRHRGFIGDTSLCIPSPPQHATARAYAGTHEVSDPRLPRAYAGTQEVSDPRLPAHLQLPFRGDQPPSAFQGVARRSQKSSNLSHTVETFGFPWQTGSEQAQDTGYPQGGGSQGDFNGPGASQSQSSRGMSSPARVLNHLSQVARPEEFIEEPIAWESMFNNMGYLASGDEQDDNDESHFNAASQEYAVTSSPPRLQRQFAKTKLCRFARTSRCALGANCSFAHSRQELVHSLDLKKTRMCKKFMNNQCNDESCNFAHDFRELRSTDYVYKTKLCRWWKGGCKAGKACRFAHGPHELEEQMEARQNAMLGTRQYMRQYQAAASMNRTVEQRGDQVRTVEEMSYGDAPDPAELDAFSLSWSRAPDSSSASASYARIQHG